jgi:hypothetical protein
MAACIPKAAPAAQIMRTERDKTVSFIINLLPKGLLGESASWAGTILIFIGNMDIPAMRRMSQPAGSCNHLDNLLSMRKFVVFLETPALCEVAGGGGLRADGSSHAEIPRNIA